MWRCFILLLGASPFTLAHFESRRSVLDNLTSHSFSQLLCGTDSPNTETLSQCAPYRALLQTLQTDLAERRAKAPNDSEVFAMKLLSSPKTRIVLTGVIPRFDRLGMVKNSCGEVRLTYRLAISYKDGGKTYSSFLPATFLWVLVLEKSDDCRGQLRVWDSKELKASLSSLTVEGQRLELNLFALHRPAPYAPKSAGYSEYLMRVFRFDKTVRSLTPLPLENTPDVEKIESEPKLKADFHAFLAAPENREAIRRSELILPERFLATKALSISPFGSLRLANAPFSRLRSVLEPPLLRRLNALSCQGCHQTASIAGFHFVGAALADSASFNQTLLPASPHFFAEQAWRQSFVSTYLDSQKLLPRPVPGRRDESPGIAGDVCAESALSNYGCQAKHSCRLPWEQAPDAVELQIGYCQKEKAPLPGEPCFLGTWKENDALTAGLANLSTTNCFGQALCLPQEIGFPGGLCVRDCETLQPGTACARVPKLQEFADCRAKGSLKECFEKHSEQTQTRACSVDSPCRPDYSCAGRADKKLAGVHGEGVCVPPYFLPELNISGHQL